MAVAAKLAGTEMREAEPAAGASVFCTRSSDFRMVRTRCGCDDRKFTREPRMGRLDRSLKHHSLTRQGAY